MVCLRTVKRAFSWYCGTVVNKYGLFAEICDEMKVTEHIEVNLSKY